MSQLNTTPVLVCKRPGCGRFIVVAHLSTERPDAEGELLHTLMAGINKIAYCPQHQKERNYYATIGRLDDWEAGRP